jgi:hypothetical protein
MSHDDSSRTSCLQALACWASHTRSELSCDLPRITRASLLLSNVSSATMPRNIVDDPDPRLHNFCQGSKTMSDFARRLAADDRAPWPPIETDRAETKIVHETQ